MKDRNDEQELATVVAAPKQAGEAGDPWWWVERCVWTERMLTRLTPGEPANRVWFALADKTYAPAELQSAFEKVWRTGGSAGAAAQTVGHFARHAEAELRQPREATAGDTGGAGPHRARRAAARSGTDLRAGHG